MPASIIDWPDTRSAKCSSSDANPLGTDRYSSMFSSARIGAPAAIRPTSGTWTPRSGSGPGPCSPMARGFVGSFFRSPRRSRLASWLCTLEDEVRPTASPISRTVGG